jgi:hypothetical protein
MTADLKAHADRLRGLHHAGEMLVLPNVWDAASAKIVAEAGFPVVATASAAISAMLGYPDGEGAPWQEMFAAAGRVARAVPVPVTVDAEAGYGMQPRELVDRLLEIGAVGCNLEDTDHHAGGLVDAGAQSGPPRTTPGSRSSSTRAPTPSCQHPGCPSRSGLRRRYAEVASTWRPGPTASTRSVSATRRTSLPWSPACPGRSMATPGPEAQTWPSCVNWAWRGSPMAPGSIARRWPT